MDGIEDEQECKHEQAEEQGVRDGVLYLLCPEPCGKEMTQPSVVTDYTPPDYGTVTLKLTLTLPLRRPHGEYSDPEFEAFLDDVCGDVTLFLPRADVTVDGVSVEAR